MKEIPKVMPGEPVTADQHNALLDAIKICWNASAKYPVQIHKAASGWVISGGKWVEIFFDNFNTENGGAQAANWTGWANWTIDANNYMDIIASSPGNPTGGDGLFVDMSGTTGITTPNGPGFISEFYTQQTWTESGRYRISFRLGGSQRGANSLVTISLGTAYVENFTLASADAWQVYTRTFRINGNGGPILARCETTNQGPSTVDRGALFDNVKLERFE